MHLRDLGCVNRLLKYIFINTYAYTCFLYMARNFSVLFDIKDAPSSFGRLFNKEGELAKITEVRLKVTTRMTLRPWNMSREGQRNWWGVWSTNLRRSSWGSWDCLAWRRGGSETSLHSTASWREVVMRRGLASSPRQKTGPEEMAASCIREGLD